MLNKKTFAQGKIFVGGTQAATGVL